MQSRLRWVLAILAAFLALMYFFPQQKTVTLLVNDQPSEITTSALTVQAALADAGISVHPEDIILPEPNTRLQDGQSILVQQAALVLIQTDGDIVTLHTAERSPANIAAVAGIRLDPNDQIYHNRQPVSNQDTLPYSPTLQLEIRRAVTLTVIWGGQRQDIVTTAATIGQALYETGAPLYAADQVSPALETPLTGDMTVEIESAQLLSISYGGQVIETRAAGDNIGAALAAAGIALQGSSYTQPGEDQALPANGQIDLTLVTEAVVLEQEPLPFDTLTQPSAELEIDTFAVVQAGQYGLQAKRVRVRYENGVEVSRTVEAEWVARQPVPRIEGYGTNIVVRTLQTPNGPIDYWRAVSVYATSYSASRAGTPPDAPNYGITYSGAKLTKGHIAVIRSWYPSMGGRSFYVDGYGFGTVADIGGGISGQHWIDLGYDDDNWISWSRTTILYFLTPVPPADQILWILP